MTSGTTDRDRAKADRHAAILRESSRLFAERGFSGVSLEELGAAVGISGPALYRHFAGKQALLGDLLVGVSERLRDGGRAVVAGGGDPAGLLHALIAFHVEFALSEADVIRVQDRDLASLADEDLHDVRRLQREYLEAWIGVLAQLHPDRSADELRVRAHACFGLMNSTPHSSRVLGVAPTREILEAMAFAALTA